MTVAASPTLKELSRAVTRVTTSMQRVRWLAGTHGTSDDVPELERLERAAARARYAAGECLDLERMLRARLEQRRRELGVGAGFYLRERDDADA